jgi:hypothetical protein
MSKQLHFKNFNETYFLFLKFIKSHMNNDSNFNTFYMKNKIIKQTNIKLLITTWNISITKLYYNEIMNQDFDFFLKKSYDQDIVASGESPDLMLKYINDFKKLFPSLDDSIKTNFTNYMTQLTKLSYLYFNE